MAARELPSSDYLHKLLRYEPETGLLFWRERTDIDGFLNERTMNSWNARFPGKEAGCQGTGGYLQIKFSKTRWKAHRVIWKMIHNSEPDEVDHINGITDDNRIENLRSVSHTENMHNKARRHDGIRSGVNRLPDGKWKARMYFDGVRKSLGVFATIEEAIAARDAAEVRRGYHPNHDRVTHQESPPAAGC